ncbi:MAG TPA: ATP/GTP-binding protein [Euzebya sp.]|nr:ATP/GTP-binding protein [Euzebya sp.]
MPDAATSAPTSVKVVFTGPYGVGKTTMIRTLSEINVLTTERRVAMGDEQKGKGSTTVAMDFGRLTIDADLQLYLFGTPGQKRFDFMWEILSEGMLGFVVMLDHTRPDSVLEAIEILAYFTQRADVPHIIGINKVPPGEDERAIRVARHQLRVGEEVRVAVADARDRDSAKDLLIELFHAAREHDARRAALEIDVSNEPEHTW